MMHVTLRQLQAFEAVARLRSFSRAAEEMHVTQPTVSKQIRALHEQVGLPLLEQVGKKVFLTEAGQELYATCADWLNTWGRFEQAVANLKGLKQGRLKIAAVTTAKYFMPRILGPFCSQYPGIDISLEVVNRDRVLDRMARNEDDLYVMGVPPDDMDIESEAFMDNPIVVIAPVGHRLADRRRIPFAALGDETFLVREQGSGTRMTMERLFQEQGVPLNIRMELGSNEAIKQAVAGGLGLALLSRSTLNFDPIQNELAVLDVEGFPIRRAWYIVRPKGKNLSVVAATFHDFLLSHVQLFVPHA
ncbi:LysR family transcriptional regulator [Acidihalobacter aeolianus]|uniref:LysR family transcriptional regulator n=2 Tax=Acidihalobacter TaxID=1765964 RepID=A0A1D8K8L5_9GAMM|nr:MULTISPECIES: LysR family transcriptional regulator [Acidihalobacter]AOV17294.1 LysR family transcriptional regulator [Acidihalobacter aeolianus]OBS10372.1 LysR family transcriptional regulator [Acidihalobacter prosperus]